MNISKAKSEVLQSLFEMAFHHERMEGDTDQQRNLVHFANENGLTHLLPERAHGMMHDMSIPHKHDGLEEDHQHTVTKAYAPFTQEFTISKSWSDEGNTYVEGYISPRTFDTQKQLVEPEAFKDSLGSYFARSAPVSTNHNMVRYPVGHMQKGALVRDGKIFAEFLHPTDPAEFTSFDGTGSGWYGRIVINDPQASGAIQKGNLGGFSWTGNARQVKKLPGGLETITEVNHVMEATVAAYPVNQDATIAIAKAYGLQEETMPEKDRLYELMSQILDDKTQQAAPVSKGIDEAQLAAALNAFKTDILSAVNGQVTELKKAFDDAQVPQRGAGAGRALDGVTTNEPTLQDAPVDYLIKKARSGEEMTEAECALVWEVSRASLTRGMAQSAGSDGGVGINWITTKN